jgi:lysophospholipase L1-like esterase
VETINAAAPGLDTGHIAAMLPRLLTLKPDAVVIYTGHNDLGNGVFYNRYGSSKDRWIARIRAGMGWSRLFGWVEGRLRNREVFVPPTPQSQGSFRVSMARRREIQHVYGARLRRIVSEVKESGAVVVLATVASNPHAPSPEWECPEALARIGLGRPRPAAFSIEDLDIGALETQLQDWPDCRDLAWLKARLAVEAGESAGREELEALRDSDPLPMRADRAIVEVIRTVAAEADVRLADVNLAFRDQGGGLEAVSLFVDFVHPSVEGQRTIAEVVAPVLAEGLGLPSPLQ